MQNGYYNKVKETEVNMKKILPLILILTSYPVFASCPISDSACIAEYQQTQSSNPLTMPIPKNSSANTFVPTPSATSLKREIAPARGLRMFGSTDEDYGYNASCQFGVCQNTGTPKTFSPNNEQRF